MAQIVDTSVLVAVERVGRTLTDLRTDLADENIAIAAITASELLVGIYYADSPRRRHEREDYVEEILRSLPLIQFDLPIARVHARLAYEMRRAGSQIGAYDLEIAATAVARGFEVVTANVGEFARVPGLSVHSYP